jgi:hypothetical protein
MKNLLIHGVYISVIAVLSFLLYDKTKTDDFVFMKSSEALAINFERLERQIPGILKEIESSINAEPKYRSYLDMARKSYSHSIPLDSRIKTLMNQKNVSPQDINLLKKDVLEESNQFLALILNEQDRKEIRKKFYLNNLITDDSFWDNMSKTKNKGFINQLSIIQSLSINDRLMVLYYYQDKIGCDKCAIIFDGYKVAIAPKKAFLLEGEKMEAEIYLARFAKSSDDVISIETNGQNLLVKDGIARFQEVTQKIGTHVISSKASYKNLKTGETLTVRGELKYEVLPKCSRDCAKNQ